MATTAPYGSWTSAISAASLAASAVRLSDLMVDGEHLYWVERRPDERGRQAIVRRTSDGAITDVIGSPYSARSLVHEYGGTAYAVRDGVVWFVNADDQRIWRLLPDEEPSPITPDDGARFADLDISPDGANVAAIRERHEAEAVVNDLVVVPSGGGPVSVVASGHDFYNAPRWSVDGSELCWLSWDHPEMPWDTTELWRGTVDGPATLVTGGASISQPRWLPDGRLAWVSDESGWWNLFIDGVCLLATDAEFSLPDWVFGQARYAPTGDGRIIAASTRNGSESLHCIDGNGGATQVDVDFTSFASVRVRPDGTVACIAASPIAEPAVVLIDLTGEAATVEVIKAGAPTPLDAALISRPTAIDFPSSGDRTAHALFYPPHNPAFAGPADQLPPLVVMTHGGPTSATSATLDRRVQFWTSRGVAVVDVNYGGSTGYGRPYREGLRGQWGVVDVDDAVAAAEFLAADGSVDGSRMVIRGGSAGGFTTLAALTFRSGVFAAGTSLYGVGDLALLASDTHKFEARYLDGLVGPYPAAEATYVARSPIHHTDLLRVPLLLLQGSEDKVVPPNQAEVMADALRSRGIPFAHVVFAGEQHGFRQAETIVRAAELELWFYGRVLGFQPADPIEPGPLENESNLPAASASR